MISILAVTTTSTWLTVIAGSTVVSGLVSVFVTQFFRKGEFRRDQRLRLRAYATCIGAFYTAIQSVDQVASAAALGTAGAQVAAEADKNYVTANRDLNDAEAMVRLVGKRKAYATLSVLEKWIDDTFAPLLSEPGYVQLRSDKNATTNEARGKVADWATRLRRQW